MNQGGTAPGTEPGSAPMERREKEQCTLRGNSAQARTADGREQKHLQTREESMLHAHLCQHGQRWDPQDGKVPHCRPPRAPVRTRRRAGHISDDAHAPPTPRLAEQLLKFIYFLKNFLPCSKCSKPR